MHASYSPQDFLYTLALVLGVAAVTTIVSQRLRQPVVFGYMLAGLIVGPHVPIPLVANEQLVHTLSELGVILLMFSIGLEFSLRRLASAGLGIAVVAALETAFMMWLGFSAARLFGWAVFPSIYAGAAVAISSTTIIAKAFAQEGVKGKVSDLVFGVLIVEDLIAVVLLALLIPAGSGTAPTGSLAVTILRLVAFLAVLLTIGMLVVPRLMRFVVRLERPETTLVASIGICFAVSLLAQRIGYSVALGAFLAGSLIAESGKGHPIGKLIEPVRDMFVAIFFVSVGMLIDPSLVLKHWPVVLTFSLLVVSGKVIAVTISAFLTGTGIRTALQAGLSLAQIGEFSFIIAGVGLASGAVAPAFYPIMVAVSAITTLTTPWLIRSADRAAAAVDRKLPRRMQTFVALYGSWIETLRAVPETLDQRTRLHRILRVLVVDAAVIVVLGLAASLLAAPDGDWLAARLGITPEQARLVVVGGAIALSLPFVIGIIRTGRALGQVLARRAFPDPAHQKLDLAAAPRRALTATIQIATVLAVGTPLVAVLQPLVPTPVGLAFLAVALPVLGIIMWRTATDLQGHVRAAAEVIVAALGRHAAPKVPHQGELALERAYALLPGLGEPVPVRIAEASAAVGRSLADLELRGRTGATVVAISRDEDVVLVPDGHEVVRAGDVLALAGTRGAIEAAKELLALEAR